MSTDEINKTPRTDKMEGWGFNQQVWVDFARQLERELNKANRQLNELRPIKVMLEAIREMQERTVE